MSNTSNATVSRVKELLNHREFHQLLNVELAGQTYLIK